MFNLFRKNLVTATGDVQVTPEELMVDLVIARIQCLPITPVPITKNFSSGGFDAPDTQFTLSDGRSVWLAGFKCWSEALIEFRDKDGNTFRHAFPDHRDYPKGGAKEANVKLRYRLIKVIRAYHWACHQMWQTNKEAAEQMNAIDGIEFLLK